jgi:hypothetical protein
MSTRSSIVDRLMATGFEKKGLQLNFMYVIFLVLALVLTGVFAYSDLNNSAYGAILTNVLFVLTAILAGVTGHLLQGPFQVFSVVLFLAVFNFFSVHYQHFTTASSPAVLTAMKTSAELLFWTLSFFGIIYLLFVFFPQINQIIPTAEEAYKMMKRNVPAKMAAPKMAAPSAGSA